MNEIPATETTSSPGHEIVSGLQSTLTRYCLSLTGSRTEAEDLAQDAWLKALGKLRIPGHPNPEALLLRIAKNAWIDRSRRIRTGNRLQLLERPQEAPQDAGLFELEAIFGALVKHLSPLQRSAFLLRDVFGYSNAEAAARLHTTEGAVKTALHRARQSLHSVREEIREPSKASRPDREGLTLFLRALAAAYRSEDIARLTQLAQMDVLPPVTAIGIAQARLLRERRPETRQAPGMMAA